MWVDLHRKACKDLPAKQIPQFRWNQEEENKEASVLQSNEEIGLIKGSTNMKTVGCSHRIPGMWQRIESKL
ncbi:unnamed protein product [Ranitomeya imitator]|uniref:Uncharacterized protein n=1 Tax=Ranitomeya imitator TaxID=111125 RepID=A0ABN9L5X0_9NEOB|nr:unnamed protein product [Ranitomeya imitator]